MHLTESLSKYLVGIPVVHEVAAGIAAEYFNEISTNGRALALVTTGPGITNTVTAIAGAWLESRELLVIGGQVKTIDLATNGLRARGIQEVNGVDLLKPSTKISCQIKKPIDAENLRSVVSASWLPRKGPVFLEIPLDVQAVNVEPQSMKKIDVGIVLPRISEKDLEEVVVRFNESCKPVLLIGGGVSYRMAVKLQSRFQKLQIPLMTTYNGADRIDGDASYFLGRPNTWGQRSSNIIIQQSDLIIAVGTRLGMQQTGFNWQEFGRDAHIIQIEIDPAELKKGHPTVDKGICVDADDFLKRFTAHKLTTKNRWLMYARKIRSAVPRVENVNQTAEGFLSPYKFITSLENLTNENDLIIPCSSGSAFTLAMQLYKQKLGQRILTNKSLASMGYGLSGAIGACIGGDNKRRTILIEGDGGFAQNMQEVGTAEINNLNLKIFIFHDQGHASIRMTQKSYFKGRYLGCDRTSGLGLPTWNKLFKAWDVPVIEVNQGYEVDALFLEHFKNPGLCAFIVQIDPDQTYFPKISSRVTDTGSMESNPIDQMTPDIDYLTGIIF